MTAISSDRHVLPELTLTRETLRSVMRRWTTGIAVITSVDPNGTCAAMTANSVTSVSLDPPLVSWCLDRTSTHYDTHSTATAFAINILAAGQETLCWHFARKAENKLAGIDVLPNPHGAPLLAGALAHLDCRTWARYPAGDHLIMLGEVVSARAADLPPLALSRGEIVRVQPVVDPSRDS